MSKLSRTKGKKYERHVSNRLKAMGHATRRGVQFQGGPDSPDVVGIPGVHIECKHMARVNIQAAMRQALADCGENVPVIFHRSNRGDDLVSLRLDDLPTLLDKWDASLALAKLNRGE